MENNKKHKQEGLKEQVHSEFETSIGNNFETVQDETAVKRDTGDRDAGLNLPEQYDDAVRNESFTKKELPKMNAGEKDKVDNVVALIGLLGLIGLIGLIKLVK